MYNYAWTSKYPSIQEREITIGLYNGVPSTGTIGFPYSGFFALPSFGDFGSSYIVNTAPSCGDSGSSYILNTPPDLVTPVHHIS